MQTQMQAETSIESHTQLPPIDDISRWHMAKRIAFRFMFAYLVLYNFLFPVQHIPYAGDFLIQKYNDLWHVIVPWVGKHVLHLKTDIAIAITGSGDTTYDYVMTLSFLILAAAATVGWSLLDRKRINYEKLHQWLRLYIRLALAGVMILYGAMKAFPLQFPTPYLFRLLQTYGESSPMGLLWTFMGASPTYTTITGCLELLGGTLSIFPRTTVLGALVSFGAMTQVFILNMCYDVPVKLFSFHLVLMSIFLMAPYLRRMSDLLVFNRSVAPVAAPALFQKKWPNRIVLIVQIVLGLYLLGLNIYQARDQYLHSPYSAKGPKPPMYGIWSVEEFTVNGEVKPPLLTDKTRWRRVILEFPETLIIQPMNGLNQFYSLQLDMENKTMSLERRGEPTWNADLTFEEAEPGHLSLAGEVEGQQTQIKLMRTDESKYLLRSRGFHWIQEYPLNR